MKTLDTIATGLIVIGALNWGLVGFAHFDLVAAIFGMKFGQTSALTSTVYGLVGLAGVYRAIFWKRAQRGETRPVKHMAA